MVEVYTAYVDHLARVFSLKCAFFRLNDCGADCWPGDCCSSCAAAAVDCQDRLGSHDDGAMIAAVLEIDRGTPTNSSSDPWAEVYEVMT